MVSHLFYYQLALLALVWLFLMVHVTWPKRGVTSPSASAQPKPLPPGLARILPLFMKPKLSLYGNPGHRCLSKSSANNAGHDRYCWSVETFKSSGSEGAQQP